MRSRFALSGVRTKIFLEPFSCERCVITLNPGEKRRESRLLASSMSAIVGTRIRTFE